MSPSEAKDALAARCQDLQRLFAGHSVPSRTLLLRLREQLAPLVDLGIRRTDIWHTIREAGWDVSCSHVCEVLSELFGPAYQRTIPPNLKPELPSTRSHVEQPASDTAGISITTVPTTRFHMSFGDEKEAREQQERLAHARAKIDADRDHRRKPQTRREGTEEGQL